MVKVQNVTFFRKNNLIQIARGLKQVWVSYTQGGVLVIKMEGYDRYYFCPDTFQVFSRKSSKNFEPLTSRMDGAKIFYFLYRYGVSKRVYVWEILRDNMTGIETFCHDRTHGKKQLEVVS